MKQINKQRQEQFNRSEYGVLFDKSKDDIDMLEQLVTWVDKSNLSNAYYNCLKDGFKTEAVGYKPLSYFFEEEQEIIGYEAPFDMYNGRVKKGDIASKVDAGYNIKSILYLPTEIVEKYFTPIYKEKPIMIGNFEVEFIENCNVQINGTKCTTSGLYELQSILKWQNVTSIKWHNADVTLGTINKIIEKLKTTL